MRSLHGLRLIVSYDHDLPGCSRTITIYQVVGLATGLGLARCDDVMHISQAFQPEFIRQPTGVSKQVAKAASQHKRARTRASTVVAQLVNIARLTWIVAWCIDAAMRSKWLMPWWHHVYDARLTRNCEARLASLLAFHVMYANE